LKYLIATVWVLLTCMLGYIPSQDDFILIIGLYAPLFVLYLITYRLFTTHKDILFFVFIALFVRFCLLFAFPNLSDDIYRFLWDGHLTLRGVNPFFYTPAEWMEMPDGQSEVFQGLFPFLNSPEYYSVYPPVCQSIFAFVVKCFPDSFFWASVLIKLFFLVAELITIYILLKLVKQLGIQQKRVLLYALNPLIIIELSGNLHFEAIMIFFLVIALWSFYRNRSKLFGIFMACSIGTKLLPLMFLPFFLRRLSLRDMIWAFVSGILALSLFTFPFFDLQVVTRFTSSIELYFQKFEFNASIYYVFRWLGYQWKGYNLIQSLGPLLSYLTIAIILIMAWRERTMDLHHFLKASLLTFTAYLLLATTVHPWYLSIPILLSVFTYYRYPVFWSGLIFFTYINYSYQPYHENLWIVAGEYLIVLSIFVMEWFKLPVVKVILDVSKLLLRGTVDLYWNLRGEEGDKK